MTSRTRRINPVALVTGASRGIGQATALTLAEAGFDLVVTATTEGGATGIARKIAKLGRRALPLRWEASSRVSADTVVARAIETFGRLDVLVNNAGVVVRKTVATMSDDDFDKVLQVNLSGPFYLARRVLPHMLEQRAGRIINVSSISATLGSARHSGYAASKAGLDALTRSLAEELRGTGVTATSVLPGSVDTDMLEGSGFEAMMTPEDVAGVIRYLACDAPEAMRGSRVEVFG